ncbi:MAG TPA: hypothetical protein DEA55_10915 [Rhodospirillaceae bacterium]|nr:hypothetical protein [Rhodospirillaceae bacterium]
MRIEEFLEKSTETRSFAKGECIVVRGQQADAAYIIKQGKAKVYRDEGNEAPVMALLGPGEIFGEMAILRFDHYTLSVKAVEDVVAYVITPDMLHEQMRDAHPLMKKVLDTLLDRMKEVNQVLMDIDQAGSI